MTLFFKIIAIVFLLLAGIISFALTWTWQMGRGQNQQLFLRGTLPNPAPSGFYKGTTTFSTAWRGKTFDAANATGINVVKDGSGQTEKYPFKTYAGGGVVDKNVQVLKIDYDIPGNPWWLRMVLDEIVEVGPNHYLGKMHVKIIPGLPFSVLYFELRKDQ